MLHTFQAHLKWRKTNESNRRTVKNHTISIENKPELSLSAAKAFKGDATQHNPEDLLLSSLMSCHMMSYLYCCEKHGVELEYYEDSGEAFLEVNADGSGRINLVILKPKVRITNFDQHNLALELHEEAHRLCFIANSCRFEIKILPEIISL